MYPPVVTRDPTAVEVEIQSVYLAIFPGGDKTFVSRAFDWTVSCFAGRYRDYQAVDAPYHDLEHSLQGALCMSRLLLGRHHAGAQPALPRRMFELGLLAILLHDSGYLKKRGDNQGTGAKYTVTHVERSARFAGELLAEKGFTADDCKSVGNMIHCTGLDAALGAIVFAGEAEQTAGFALGTGDLLGQMAAEDYLEKLPLLYEEFSEAARYSDDKSHFVASYSSAEDLIKKTPDFWEAFVRPKLERDFGGIYRFLNKPYPDGPNCYLERIEANMQRLRRHSAAATHC